MLSCDRLILHYTAAITTRFTAAGWSNLLMQFLTANDESKLENTRISLKMSDCCNTLWSIWCPFNHKAATPGLMSELTSPECGLRNRVLILKCATSFVAEVSLISQEEWAQLQTLERWAGPSARLEHTLGVDYYHDQNNKGTQNWTKPCKQQGVFVSARGTS